MYALVRDTAKAAELFDPTNELLMIRKTDLGSEEDVMKALEEEDCEAAIWCATGFSDAPDQSIWTKVSDYDLQMLLYVLFEMRELIQRYHYAVQNSVTKQLQAMLGLATKPKGTIDAVGLPALGKALSKKGPLTNESGAKLPRVVMLSSAGVTRPGWSEEKKKELDGSAGIPIVRLNPFGILGVKEESENELRRCGEYCIFFVTGGVALYLKEANELYQSCTYPHVQINLNRSRLHNFPTVRFE